MPSEPDQVINDERLDSLERFRDVEFTNWKADLERRFAEAFPGGDHVGHCRYHALMIEQIEDRRRLRAVLTEKTVGWLILGTIGGAAAAAWWAFVEFITKVKGGS